VLILGVGLFAGCGDCNKTPQPNAQADAAAPVASAGDASVTPKAAVNPAASDLPAWPGWPLPTGQKPTPAMYCEASFALGLLDQHPNCSDAEFAKQQARFVSTKAREHAKGCIKRLEASVENGRVHFDSNMASQCIVEHVVALSRHHSESPHAAKACDDTIDGRQKKGDPCREPWECEANLTCVGFTDTKEGTCGDPPALGQACGEGQHDGISINVDIGDHSSCAAGAHCVSGKCEARVKEGAGCATDDACMEGFACIVGKCAKRFRGAAGAACQRDDDCQSGLDCLGAPASAVANPDPKTLGKCTAERAAGEACKDDTECKGTCENGKCVSLCGSG
jgi:hypothetical protein